MTADVEVVDCEGSAQPGPIDWATDEILCKACCEWWPILRSIDGPVIPYHQRRAYRSDSAPGQDVAS